jgi:subtilisin-like proprotein convertase family protein
MVPMADHIPLWLQGFGPVADAFSRLLDAPTDSLTSPQRRFLNRISPGWGRLPSAGESAPGAVKDLPAEDLLENVALGKLGSRGGAGWGGDRLDAPALNSVDWLAQIIAPATAEGRAADSLAFGPVNHLRVCACAGCQPTRALAQPVGGTTSGSGDLRIDALLGGYRLGASGGANVTFSFVNGATAAAYTDASPYGERVSELSSTIKGYVRTILKSYIEPLVNLTFTEVIETADRVGQMRLMFSDMGGDGGYAYAYYPMSDSPGDVASDIHLSRDYTDPAYDPVNNFATGPGSHGFTTLIHEIGHALGLSHPFEDPPLPVRQDNLNNTVMSYTFAGSSPTTLMPYDIAALKHIYGSKAFQGGNTTYRFTNSHAYTVNGDAATAVGGSADQRLTLVDTGGTDTLDLSALPGEAGGYTIDLRANGVLARRSDLDPETTIATKGTRFSFDTVLEQVINSASDDVVVANGRANVFGGYGAFVATGNDIIRGANQLDRLDLSGFVAAGVNQTQSGSDLVLGLGEGRSITLSDYFATPASDRIQIQYAPAGASFLAIAASSPPRPEGDSGRRGFTFTVTRTGALTRPAKVNWAVAGTGDNPAQAADFADWVWPRGQLAFAPGATSRVITVKARGDTAIEPDETFAVRLSNPTNGAAIAIGSATDTILNDDFSNATLAIATASPSLPEGNAGSTTFTFTVTRAGKLSAPTTVNWAVGGTSPNPAGASDFVTGTLPRGQLTFAPGETTRAIAVNIGGDGAIEPNETFTVTLSNPTGGAVLTTATATATILDDDGGPVVFANTSRITLADQGQGTPYPATIDVAGLVGPVSDIRVTLKGVYHTWPDDIDVLLVGPTGASVVLMSDAGGNTDITNANLSFATKATATLSEDGQIVSGTYRPTNFDSDDSFGAPAPGGPYGSDLSVFSGTDPNGAWRLYAIDDTASDTGYIAGGWELSLGTGSALQGSGGDRQDSALPTSALATDTLAAGLASGLS